MLAAARALGPIRRSRALAVFALALGALFALGAAAPAFAHAELQETTPADGAVLDTAPTTVELRFNEPVQVVDDGMLLFPGGGEPLPLQARTVNTTVTIELPAAGLEPNAYTVAYRIVSADGHPLGGAVSFQVGDGDFTAADITAAGDPVGTEVIVSVLTGALYAGLLALAGLVMFDVFVAGPGHPAAARTRRLTAVAFAVAAAAALLLIPAAGARVAGKELVSYLGDSGDLLLLSPRDWLPGVATPQVVTAVVVVACGALALVCRAGGDTRRPLRAVALASALIAAATPLLVGHTQTVSPGWAMLTADLVHLITGAFWIGGIVGLLALFRAARTAGTAEADTAEAVTATTADTATAASTASTADAATAASTASRAAGLVQTVSRFSGYAAWSVGFLAASGVVMGVLIVGSVTALVTTSYGILLLVKLGVVAAVVALAALNRLYVLPRISARPAPARQVTLLRRTLIGEAALLAVVIAVTGVLTNTSPAAEARPGVGQSEQRAEVSLSATSQGLTVDGVLTRDASQQATVTFTLEYDGAPVTGDEVSFEARLPAEQLGPFSTAPTFDAATGSYTASVPLPVAGDWQLQFAARIDTFTQPIAVVTVSVP